MQRDSKRIARQWNQEIDDEIRREADQKRRGGGWKRVVWGALWLVWLLLVAAGIARVAILR